MYRFGNIFQNELTHGEHVVNSLLKFSALLSQLKSRITWFLKFWGMTATERLSIEGRKGVGRLSSLFSVTLSNLHHAENRRGTQTYIQQFTAKYHYLSIKTAHFFASNIKVSFLIFNSFIYEQCANSTLCYIIICRSLGAKTIKWKTWIYIQ